MGHQKARGADIEGWFLNMGHQKQGSSIREPYLGRVEPGTDIEGWFLNMGHQKQTGFLDQRSLHWQGRARGLIMRASSSIWSTRKQGSSIRKPYLCRVEPWIDNKGSFLDQGQQKQGSSIREPYLCRVEPGANIERVGSSIWDT